MNCIEGSRSCRSAESKFKQAARLMGQKASCHSMGWGGGGVGSDDTPDKHDTTDIPLFRNVFDPVPC